MAVDVSQYVAQFGRNTGAPIAAGINRGMERGNRNRMIAQNRQDTIEQRNILAKRKQQEEQRQFLQDGVKALQSVPEAQQPQVYAGWYNEAQRRGYDLQGEPTPDQYGPQVLHQLMGAAGVTTPGFGKASTTPAAIQDRESLFKIIQDPNAPEWQVKAARVELGLDPRAVGSSSMTIADTGKTQQVAGSEAIISGAKAGASEEAKLQQQGRYKPMIEAAITTARDQAKARGEALTSLHQAEAAMPGLEETVGQLKELAPLVTSTLGGKIFDTAVKQAGFGSTEGATARAKFIAIIDSQVLPLLRQTFGAAFTEREGQTLKATMGDPDATPEQKAAQLDAFIAQKYRDIQARQQEAQSYGAPQPAMQPPPESQQAVGSPPAGWQLMEDAAGNRAYVGPNGEVQELR